jgi:hypothetical protein
VLNQLRLQRLPTSWGRRAWALCAGKCRVRVHCHPKFVEYRSDLWMACRGHDCGFWRSNSGVEASRRNEMRAQDYDRTILNEDFCAYPRIVCWKDARQWFEQSRTSSRQDRIALHRLQFCLRWKAWRGKDLNAVPLSFTINNTDVDQACGLDEFYLSQGPLQETY